jgi:hypothetical protein
VSMAHPFDGPGRGLRNIVTDGHMPAALFPPPPGGEEAPAPAIDPGTSSEPPPVDQGAVDRNFNRATFDHVRVGTPKDGVIYVNDDGNKVMLDVRGHQYSCDLEGVRNSMKSARPADIDPEMWKRMGPNRARLSGQAEEPKAAPPSDDLDGWQKVVPRRTKKVAPQTQTAPVEGSLVKLEMLHTPDAGGCVFIFPSGLHSGKSNASS